MRDSAASNPQLRQVTPDFYIMGPELKSVKNAKDVGVVISPDLW